MMSLLMDGMLSAEEQEALEAHLRLCTGCQAEWARWRQVDALLASEHVLVPSPGFGAGVLERVGQHRRRQRRLLGGALLLGGSLSVWGMVLLALAAAALLWVLSDPRVAVHGAHVLSQLLAAGGLLVTAVRLGLVGMTSPSVLPFLVTYACAVMALTALWIRLAQRRPLRSGVPMLVL
jgi:anti-sigma factor RsiW